MKPLLGPLEIRRALIREEFGLRESILDVLQGAKPVTYPAWLESLHGALMRGIEGLRRVWQ